MTPWFTFVIAIMIDVQPYSLFTAGDGKPVYMRTEQFRVGVGNFPTLSACQAYVPRNPEEFTFTPENGIGLDMLLHNANGAPLTPGTYNVVGCVKVNVAAQ